MIKKFLALLLVLIVFGMSLWAGGTGETASESVVAVSGEFKPTKDITFVVGFDAGGTADIPARIVAKYMAKYSTEDVIVTNIVGSSGRVAANKIKTTAVDNHTLLHVPVGYFLQSALGVADFTYKDFSPVTLWCDSWVGLVVRADSRFKSYAELVSYAKQNPGQVRIGSVAGTLPQLAALSIEAKEGVKLNIVDIGLNNKATELLGGRIDAYIDGIGQYKQFVESGDFRCLMAFGRSGSTFPGYPGLLAAGDAGYSNIDYLLQSFGMWMPKGTDKAVVEYYANLIEKVSKDADCIAELNKLGYGPRYESPETYTQICESVLNDTISAVQASLK